MKHTALAISFLLIFSFLFSFPAAYAQKYQSGYAYLCPVVDGKHDQRYWQDALKIEFSHGVLMVKNNYHHLYLLMDVTSDTKEDAILKKPVCDDYFEIYFDWDGNGKITRNIDRAYTVCNNVERLIYRYILQKDVLSSVYFSGGKVRAGFGPTLNSPTPHRFYEMVLPLSEAKIEAMTVIKIGWRVVSKNPYIDQQFPDQALDNITRFYTIDLSFPPQNIESEYIVGSLNMKINGADYTMDVAPYIYQRRTFLPIRFVVEPFGGFFEWNSSNQRLIVFVEETNISMTMNSPLAYVNGKQIQIDSTNKSITPQLKPPGRVMVPLRFLAEAVGCNVIWEARLQKAIVKFKRK